jgi:exopolysaccharide biosynthesis polyprenyl glycosylphosphotransferase
VPDVLSMERSNLEFLQFGKIPVLHLRPTSLEGWGKVWKRLIDIFGSIVGLIALSPLLIAIAIAIKLDSKGPVLFTQLDDGSPALRIGQYGRPFQFFKFRTMAPNSHNKRYEELAEHNIRKGPIVKIKNDPRVTRLGHFLRRFDLDELPQLWNVLKGDMSLIGPRPHLPEEVKNYQNHHYFLLHIKPGMTGWAQVNGRSDLDFEDEVKLDSYYIRNWSLILDFKILFKTIAVIFQKHQAD